MPALRGPDGKVIFVGDEEVQRYTAGGEYERVDSSAAGAAQSQIAAPEVGIRGQVRGALSSFVSGATLGLSDLLLTGSQQEEEQLRAERAENPLLSGTLQAAGMIVPALVSGGAATPSGYLSSITARAGAEGGVKALAATASEGAIQNAGIYLSDVALGDRKASAEGVAGALGMGLAFGAAAHGAAQGIEAGTIAARRMFARYAEGGEKAAQQAAQQWSETSAKTLEGYDQAAELARARLVEAAAAREQAALAQQQAAAGVAEARAGLGRPPVPTAAPAPPVPPEVEIAGLLNDRARAAVSRQGAAAWDAANGARLQQLFDENMAKTYSSAGGPPPAGALPPERAARVFGEGVEFAPGSQIPAAPARSVADLTGVPVRADLPNSIDNLIAAGARRVTPEAEAEMGAALSEYTAARRAFDDMRARVDPDLEAALRGLMVPEAEWATRVPIGEFAPPGKGGIKTQGELARLAAGTGAPEAASAARVTPGVTSDLRGGVRGTPAGKSLGEIAAEQGPNPAAEPIATTKPYSARGYSQAKAGARFASSEEAAAKLAGPHKPVALQDAEQQLRDMGLDVDAMAVIRERGGPGVRGIPEYSDLRANLAKSGDDYAENILDARDIAARGYYEPPGGGADKVRVANARRAIAEGQREPIKLGVDPDGKILVTDGRHRLAAAIEADAPIHVKWTTSYPPTESDVFHAAKPVGAGRAAADGDLEALLRGTQERLASGEPLADIGAQSRGAYAAEKLAARAEAAERFSPMGRAEQAAQEAAAGRSEATSAFKLEDSGLRFDPAKRSYFDEGGGALVPPPVSEMGVGLHPRALPDEPLTAAREHPLAVKQLEMAHDAALERAATVDDPIARRLAINEAKAIEEQLSQVGARPGAVEDIAVMAEVTSAVEKAAARLTDALGPAAPPAAKEAAKAFRAAEDAASRRTVSRIARSADDWSAEQAALPGEPTGQQRVAAAKQAKLEADARLATARAAESEAKLAARTAEGQAGAARARPGQPVGVAGGPGPGKKVLEGAKTVATAAELAADFGIPGVPKPHNIPVIGPILSAYLKYRAFRAAAGRFVGRVPATAETRAAALAAKTKDSIARAVDRSLGLVARNKPVVTRAIAASSLVVHDALSRRALDDGQPDAPKDASPPEMAVVRMREVAAAVANPQLVIDKVRRETRAILDPDLIDALESHLMAMYKHLNDTAPKGPPPNPYTKQQWAPSAADALQWGRRLAVANNPVVAFEALHAQALTIEAADTLRAVYPKLFAAAQQRLIERASELKRPVEYRQLVQNGLLFDLPLHASIDPENAAVLQSAHAPIGPAQSPGGPAGGPPAPSIANPTNLSQTYQTTADRRAER